MNKRTNETLEDPQLVVDVPEQPDDEPKINSSNKLPCWDKLHDQESREWAQRIVDSALFVQRRYEIEKDQLLPEDRPERGGEKWQYQLNGMNDFLNAMSFNFHEGSSFLAECLESVEEFKNNGGCNE